VPKDFVIQLQQQFAHHPHTTREELLSFYRSFEPDLKDSTFAWRIHSLKEKNLLKPVRKVFPTVQFCVWSTKWLNDWMIHQPGRFLLLVEAEAAATESVFYFLKDEHYKNVFLNPDDTLLERYIYEETESIIVKPLITKAPLEKRKKIATPSLEKILVDLFIDQKLFSPFQGSELIYIYNTLHSKYALNITKMTAYAKRRTKEEELLDFMTKNTNLSELLN
jgi:hypothetical protein